MSKNQLSQDGEYNLYAVLVHNGYTTKSGHYYCFVRNSNNTWYCMNDSNVQQVGINTVLKQEAYMLFYSRNTSSTTVNNNNINQNISTLQNDEPKLKKLKQENAKTEEVKVSYSINTHQTAAPKLVIHNKLECETVAISKENVETATKKHSFSFGVHESETNNNNKLKKEKEL